MEMPSDLCSHFKQHICPCGPKGINSNIGNESLRWQCAKENLNHNWFGIFWGGQCLPERYDLATLTHCKTDTGGTQALSLITLRAPGSLLGYVCGVHRYWKPGLRTRSNGCNIIQHCLVSTTLLCKCCWQWNFVHHIQPYSASFNTIQKFRGPGQIRIVLKENVRSNMSVPI